MKIISFILMILTNDSAMLLLGEIRCWSFSGFNGLKGSEKKKKEKTSKLFIVTLHSCNDVLQITNK